MTGIDRGDGDVFNALFEYQCKVRGRFPAYLRAWLQGIVLTGAQRDRTGVVIWKEAGTGHRDDDALVVLRLKDWISLHGKVDP